MTSSTKQGYPISDVHDLSVDLIEFLEDEGVEVGLAAAAVSLTLARLSSATKLSEADELMMVPALSEYASMLAMGSGVKH